MGRQKQFEPDINWNGTQHITQLSFKSDHKVLPDNYGVCVTHLKNLTKCFHSNDMLKGYHDFFMMTKKMASLKKLK